MITEWANFVMLVLVCFHFIIGGRASLRLADEKLLTQQLEPGTHFDPRSKIRVVRVAMNAICVSIILRSILTLLSALGMPLPVDGSGSYGDYCNQTLGDRVLLSRIIENEYPPPPPPPPPSPICRFISHFLLCVALLVFDYFLYDCVCGSWRYC